ncbi:IST1-like protein [Tanacetum coccineum]
MNKIESCSGLQSYLHIISIAPDKIYYLLPFTCIRIFENKLLIDKHANDKLWADNEDFKIPSAKFDTTHMFIAIDLQSAISSLCFAAPTCTDLPELIQVQMAFAGKYGKEFVAAATELMPECGVNRQLIEHLSVRAPSPENGPSILSSTQLPIPQEKHEEPVLTPPEQIHNEQSDSDTEFDILDFPEVPSSSVLPNQASETVSRPEMLPFPPSALSDLNDEPENIVEKSAKNEIEHKQFLPFISPPSDTIAVKENIQSPQTETTVSDDLQTTTVKECSPLSRTRTGIKDDFQDVLAAAKAAAENAERAAAAARAAASLAHVRINELVKKQNEYESNENPFSGDTYEPNTPEKPHLDHHDSVFSSSSPPQSLTSHQPQRLPSMDDGFMSYPNLFNSRSPSGLSPAQSLMIMVGVLVNRPESGLNAITSEDMIVIEGSVLGESVFSPIEIVRPL